MEFFTRVINYNLTRRRAKMETALNAAEESGAVVVVVVVVVAVVIGWPGAVALKVLPLPQKPSISS